MTTIVVGAVTITKPFTLTQRPFLRDIIFYLFAAYWTFYLLWTGYVNIYHAVGFVVFYAFYVVVVIVGRIVFQKWKKYRRNKRLGTGDIPSKPLFISYLKVKIICRYIFLRFWFISHFVSTQFCNFYVEMVQGGQILKFYMYNVNVSGCKFLHFGTNPQKYQTLVPHKKSHLKV